MLALYAGAALFGEVQYRVARSRDVTPAYNRVDADQRFQPPLAAAPKTGERYLLGTDNLGRSVALRLVQGTRIAFHVGIVTSLIAIPLGVLLGLLGGYFGNGFYRCGDPAGTYRAYSAGKKAAHIRYRKPGAAVSEINSEYPSARGGKLCYGRYHAHTSAGGTFFFFVSSMNTTVSATEMMPDAAASR